MKKRLMIIASVLLLGMTISCEDQFNDVRDNSVSEVESTNADEDIERERPGQN